jgi:hypothetical protein
MPEEPEAPRAIAVFYDRQATQSTKRYSLQQIEFCPVDRNRRIPNGPSGGVGGRRGQPRLLTDQEGKACALANASFPDSSRDADLLA